MSDEASSAGSMPGAGSIVCFGCRYPISGIDPRAVCPECGLPISRSMGQDLLLHGPVDYVQTLHRGVVMILTGIVASILMIFLLMGLGFAGVTSIAYLGAILGTGIALVGAAGWWSFSKPDNMVQEHAGETARQLVRIAVAIQVGITLLALLLTLTSSEYVAAAENLTGRGGFSGWTLIHWILNLASIGAGALQFFASMFYVRWLAPRLPDERVFRRAKLLMWLGPLLSTVGLLVVIGPLVALVLYYNLLNWIRLDLKAILYEQGVD